MQGVATAFLQGILTQFQLNERRLSSVRQLSSVCQSPFRLFHKCVTVSPKTTALQVNDREVFPSLCNETSFTGKV